MSQKQGPMNFNPFAGSASGFTMSAIKKALHELQTCIPAIVKEVKGRNQVIATPAVQRVSSSGEIVAWANIVLPVLVPCGGGMITSWPIKAGDTGWIVAGDLDPSLFLKDSKKPARQNIYNRHSYQFGFFIPCQMAGFNVSTDDTDALIFSTQDQKTKISLKDGAITIESSDALNIKAKTVNVEGSEKVLIKGSNSVSINGIDWETHTHLPGTYNVGGTLVAGVSGGIVKTGA